MTVIKTQVHIGFYWSATGLHPKSHVSRRSRAYLHWERSILCFWCAISIPKKYL